MKITKFAELVAEKEKGKIQISIAQIAEVLKVVNILTGGILYSLIRQM